MINLTNQLRTLKSMFSIFVFKYFLNQLRTSLFISVFRPFKILIFINTLWVYHEPLIVKQKELR